MKDLFYFKSSGLKDKVLFFFVKDIGFISLDKDIKDINVFCQDWTRISKFCSVFFSFLYCQDWIRTLKDKDIVLSLFCQDWIRTSKGRQSGGGSLWIRTNRKRKRFPR